MKNQSFGKVSAWAMSAVMFSTLGTAAFAQQATVEGLVTGRNGASMSVKTADTPRLQVLLSDTTKATEKGGFLGLGRKDLGVASLVPGLMVKVEGSYDADHKLVAQKVEFSRGAMKTAKQIDAGLAPVNEQMAAAQDAIQTEKRRNEENAGDIASAKQDISENRRAADEGLAANKQAIGMTNDRIGKMDEYETKNTVTVTFANGRSTVSKKDKEAIAEFVKSVADTPGYMIQIQGYASKSGSEAVNQRLSSERASAVVALIQQSGVVPLTRILAPAAMGTSEQVDGGKGRATAAQSRRVVVTVLVNKGIAGESAGS